MSDDIYSDLAEHLEKGGGSILVLRLRNAEERDAFQQSLEQLMAEAEAKELTDKYLLDTVYKGVH